MKKLWKVISVMNEWHDGMVRKFDILWVMFSVVVLTSLVVVPFDLGYKYLGIAGGVVMGCLLLVRIAYKVKLVYKVTLKQKENKK